MNPTARTRAAVQRTFATLAAALLLLGTFATPALGNPEAPDDVDDPSEPIAETVEPDDAEPDEVGSEEPEPDEAELEEIDTAAPPPEEPDADDVEPVATPQARALDEEPADRAPSDPDDPGTAIDTLVADVEDAGDHHCPGGGNGAPRGAINRSDGERTLEPGLTVTWGGDPGSVTFANTTDRDATVTWCAKGGNNFANGGKALGSLETDVPAGGEVTEGPYGTEISYIVFYGVEFHEPPEPDSVEITLQKAWFDLDGVLLDGAPDVDWGLSMEVGVDAEVVATLPDGNPTATLELLDGGTAAARYGVQETPAPAGWEAVSCNTVGSGDLSWVNEGTSELLVASGADSGAFGAFDSGVHLVCNQQVEEPDEPDVVTIGLAKLWLDADGEILDEAPDVDYAVTMSIQDTVLATVDPSTPAEAASTEVEVGTEYLVAEPTLPDGWREAECPAGIYGADDVIADGTGIFVATGSGRHVVCNEPIVEVLPEIVVPPDVPETPEVVEVEPEVEVIPEVVEVTVRPETDEVTTQVLGVVRERALPRTGVNLLLLTGLAGGLMLLGMTGLTSTRRR